MSAVTVIEPGYDLGEDEYARALELLAEECGPFLRVVRHTEDPMVGTGRNSVTFAYECDGCTVCDMHGPREHWATYGRRSTYRRTDTGRLVLEEYHAGADGICCWAS